MATRIASEMSEEFRLLVAEIAEAEQVPWPRAVERARAQWADVAGYDAETPIPYRPSRVPWPFIAWVWFLLFTISLSVNLVFVWLLVVYAPAL